jgi:DNA polymerase III delta prime subunit
LKPILNSELNGNIDQKTLLQDIVSASNGDLRSAINNLQFFKNNENKPYSISTCKKETDLSIFHGLGKVLYNKSILYLTRKCRF